MMLPRYRPLPFQSILRLQLQLQPDTPATIQTRMNSNLYKKLFKKWTGSGDEEHAVNRAERSDTTDPESEASSKGMADREESAGIYDRTKSQATTERGGLESERKAKKEHPHAPEPVIGMNDERVQKDS